MFNFLKRAKDKQPDEELVPWGTPTKRKMSKEEAARDEAEQRLIEKNNQERRDVYRLAGSEQVFEDNEGRRLALRVEDNSGPHPNLEHPPLAALVFWGVRELGHVYAQVTGSELRLSEYKLERGYEGRGIAAVLLREIESLGRTKGATTLICISPSADDSEWPSVLSAQSGFNQHQNEMVKSL